MAASIIALITDFGWKDGYVGAMKGVILGINPEGRIVDVAHDIPPHDILGGALVLESVFPYFPPKTVFVVVVDPGVGGRRRGIVAEVEGRFLVGPDNGLFTLVLQRGLERVHEIQNPRYMLPKVSSTFHGRDIFAPVAAHLTLGVKVEQIGPALSPEDLTYLSIPPVRRSGQGVQGEVIYADRFGNLVTNIKPEDLPFGEVVIEVEGERIQGLKGTYEEGEYGKVIALWGSHGRLELAMRERSLREERGWVVGTKVVVKVR